MDKTILEQNNLRYELPQPTSVVSSRAVKRQYPQQRTASEGQTVTFTLNTGTSLVDQANSYLFLQVTTAGGADYACSFGRGSAVNLIENVRIYSRSGAQITNTTQMNLFRKVTDRHQESGDWFANAGVPMGYSQSSDAFASLGDQTLEFVIPLVKLHPFFEEMSKRHIPSCLASGLRIELDLATVGTAFVSDPDGVTYPDSVTTYSVPDVYLGLQCVDLMSSAQATLNKVASTQSLDYTFCDIFSARNGLGTATDINFDINKSVSFAKSVYTLLQPTANLNTIASDSMDSSFRTGNWWYQLGNMYLPSNQKIDQFLVAYHEALTTFNKHKTPHKEGDVSQANFNLNEAIYSTSLERSDALSLSELPINSSRQLRFELSLNGTPPALTSTTFLTYLTNTRCSLLNVRVDI
jgi:hypothetical protein